MISVQAGEGTLGATITGVDIAKPVDHAAVRTIEQALGRHGVVRFPQQSPTPRALRDFSALFGELEINVANVHQAPGLPEVMILSNMVEHGRPLGLSDAGQSWHTDMSYSRLVAFANVLHGVKIPMRDGHPLGNTEFCNMRAAYVDLPATLKQELAALTITHDFNKFWEEMRQRPGSRRLPLTPAQRAAKPPVTHAALLEHPITRETVLYANPGYSIRVNELSERESDALLARLFEHQTQPKYRYAHKWTEGDILMWDNFGTIHNAVADYRSDEHRYIRRCQVMATRYFDSDGKRLERMP